VSGRPIIGQERRRSLLSMIALFYRENSFVRFFSKKIMYINYLVFTLYYVRKLAMNSETSIVQKKTASKLPLYTPVSRSVGVTSNSMC